MHFVDLDSQYQRLKPEIDSAIQGVLSSTQFIKGPQVLAFEASLSKYLDTAHVIACGNGTDALQIALMALDLKPGDEVIVPSFTYVATAEVIALLGLKPKMVDVDPTTFNITAEIIAEAISPATKVIVPVHLFGQSCDMDPIMDLAEAKGITVIADNAQSIGGSYINKSGKKRSAGATAHIATTSFFPSKNLGCYGDGGAMYTSNEKLAERIRMIANHGQSKKYYHAMIGVNSRLDAIQAAILNVKLAHLDEFISARQEAASMYDQAFQEMDEIQTPFRAKHSTHAFHQYTILVNDDRRDALANHLRANNIPVAIYYPLPLYKQVAYQGYVDLDYSMPNTESLCRSVLSLPMHTEMTSEIIHTITSVVKQFYGRS